MIPGIYQTRSGLLATSMNSWQPQVRQNFRSLPTELAKVAMRPLAFPVIANVDAEPNSDPARVAALLVRQVDGPVQWSRSVERMAAEGVTHALEIGPGKVLAGLVKRIAKGIRVLSVGDPAAIEKVTSFLAEA